jgi:hypothetical protein
MKRSISKIKNSFEYIDNKLGQDEDRISGNDDMVEEFLEHSNKDKEKINYKRTCSTSGTPLKHQTNET